MKDYGECPYCGQKKIYLSKANVLICGNKTCGRIFTPLSSEQHLTYAQLLTLYKKEAEYYDEIIALNAKGGG